MDSQTNYYRDGVARVIEILKDVFSDYFHAYLEGNSDELPESLLPCVMVTTTDGVIASGATGTDDIGEEIQIRVVISEKDYLGADETTDAADLAVRRLVMGQYPEGHAKAKQYIEPSIMFALRKYFTLDDGAVHNRVAFNFYPGQRGEQVFTREALLTLSIERMALVPSRE